MSRDGLSAVLVTVKVKDGVKIEYGDTGITGRYLVAFSGEVVRFKACSVALDIFHSNVGINRLDDFVILVHDSDGNLLHEEAGHVAYSCEDDGDVEKLNDDEGPQ
jgi:hypothetical protein